MPGLVTLSLVYVGVFLVTIPVWYFALPYKHVVSTNFFCSTVNSVFVQDYGYVWFTIAYLGHCAVFANLQDRVPAPVAVRQLSKYLAYVLCGVAVNYWFLGPLLVERLNVATGGHCEAKSTLVHMGMRECRRSFGNVWIDGFDLLGHYYFLLTLSLLLLDNRSNMPPASETDAQSIRMRNVLLFTRMLSAWLLTVWFLEYCVTSIFFHTIGERAAGLVGIPVAFVVLQVDRVLQPHIESALDHTGT